jgi:hypothetical protein
VGFLQQGHFKKLAGHGYVLTATTKPSHFIGEGLNECLDRAD